MKRGTKLRMTSLDRGLACSARREGMSLEKIAEALHRDVTTISNLVRKNGIYKRGKNVKRPNQS